jgi:hypothetical protein
MNRKFLAWACLATFFLGGCGAQSGGGVFDARYPAYGRYVDSGQVFAGEAELKGNGEVFLVVASDHSSAGLILDSWLEFEATSSDLENTMAQLVDQHPEIVGAQICVGNLKGDISSPAAMFNGAVVCLHHGQAMRLIMLKFGGDMARGLAVSPGDGSRFAVAFDASPEEFSGWSGDVLKDSVANEALTWP